MIVGQSGGGLSPGDLVPEKALGIRAENVGLLSCGEEGGILNSSEGAGLRCEWGVWEVLDVNKVILEQAPVKDAENLRFRRGVAIWGHPFQGVQRLGESR